MTLPVVFLPHGGGPWPYVDLGFPSDEAESLAAYLRSVSAVPATPPRALLVVSAHWEERVPTVMTAPRPPMLYDYYGFPPESYTITWPAPGEPALAARVREVLASAGLATAADADRGFDHGTFVPLKLAYPRADVPAFQLSLVRGLDPRAHLDLGRALRPLRDEGLFVVASGMTFHNLRTFFDRGANAAAAGFDAWLQQAMAQAPEERARRLVDWERAPFARDAHPREEHLLPLMVATGAAGGDAATLGWSGTLNGHRLSAFHFGTA